MSLPAASLVRLIVGAGKAAPTPPVGPALGAKGVKSMDFCKEFNARTAHITAGVPIPVEIIVQPDRSFTFTTKTPTVTYLLKQITGIEKGIAKPGHGTVATISLKHVYEIARIKRRDDHVAIASHESVCRAVVGSAASLGIAVVP